MKKTYIAFYTHTAVSDGALLPNELCRMAKKAGIGILAVADHNYTEGRTDFRKAFPKLRSDGGFLRSI